MCAQFMVPMKDAVPSRSEAIYVTNVRVTDNETYHKTHQQHHREPQMEASLWEYTLGICTDFREL